MVGTTNTDLLIGGRLRPGRGRADEVTNPATGEAITNVARATSDDLDEAFAAATSTWPEWSRVPLAERADALRKAAAALDAHGRDLTEILVAELGKPITEAEAEVQGTAKFFGYTASLAETLTDEIRYTGNRDEEIWTRRRPVGVVAAIIPWNFPSALTARKIAPAVAAGNAIVLKPDEKTPLSALAIAQVLHDSGVFPAGLINVITGPGESIGNAMVTDPRSSLVTMTGSPEAGKAILAAAAASVKPVSLELGGNAPFIVLNDTDVKNAVEDAVFSRFMNCGQVCIAAERTFVQSDIYDEFVDRYLEAVAGLRVGDPALRQTQVGPKVSEEELEKTLRMVSAAASAGASVRLGGQRLSGEGLGEGRFARGHWMAPTVVTEVADDSPLMRDEIFGPVAPISRFETWDEVAGRANATRYGLSAYVYTNDLALAMRAVQDLSFGEVYVNRAGPEEINGYHTGYRESGLGGDDGPHGLDTYFRRQTTYLRYGR